MLLPAVYVAAHMRCVIPIIPLFWLMLLELRPYSPIMLE